MKKTALERLRDELHVSRQEMADLLGTSRSNVEKYEAILTEELAAKALEIVRAKRIRHMETEFAMLAGEPIPVDKVELSTDNPAEAAFLKKCLRIYRAPKTDLQKGIPGFIDAIFEISEGK